MFWRSQCTSAAVSDLDQRIVETWHRRGRDPVLNFLAHYPDEKKLSLLPISMSHVEKEPVVQLQLPLGLEDEGRRPGSKKGMACWAADRPVD
jgi:hypothetical protein